MSDNTKAFDRALAGAKEKGLALGPVGIIGLGQILLEVVQEEREACAKLCEWASVQYLGEGPTVSALESARSTSAMRLATAIRARGEA